MFYTPQSIKIIYYLKICTYHLRTTFGLNTNKLIAINKFPLPVGNFNEDEYWPNGLSATLYCDVLTEASHKIRSEYEVKSLRIFDSVAVEKIRAIVILIFL